MIIKSKWIKRQTIKSIFLWSFLFQITVLFSYPVLSSDIFDYILNNRILAIYKQNPWITPSMKFPDDPFINLGSWQKIPSIYGPMHHFISYPLAFISGNNLIISIFSFKLIAVVFTFISAKILLNLLPRNNIPKKLSTFLFNPLLIIEFSGNAHNDIVMVTLMLASLLTFKKNKYLIAGILIGLGTLIKLYAFTLFPLYTILFLKRKEIKKLLITSIGFLATILAGLTVMGVESLRVQRKVMDWVFTLGLNSFPDALNSLSIFPYKIPFACMYIVFIPSLVYFLLKIKDQQSLIICYINLTMIYLMFILSLYWPWYVIWYLPFLSLINIKRLIDTGIIFSMTSLCYYAVLFSSHRIYYQHPLWTIIIYLFLVLPPVSVYILKTSKYAKTA